ncbi:hypothetical protein PVNG_02367 [Plasmodium vivax North Korean]|uniref:DNA gyrase subunit A n=1 Tax=Plasmodium vivax North Korean TaxID=1035514 RepID=A0A0J9TLN5_PLAVI|nr:hypothetical protein PVNG_02367 [Plasmodium vivax North Korean]
MIADSYSDILMASSDGRVAKFSSELIKPSGRSSQGVLGMKIKDDAELISISTTYEGNYLCSIDDAGKGKKTKIEEFDRFLTRNGETRRINSRTMTGVKAYKITKHSGKMVACVIADESEEIVLMTNKGHSNRVRVSQIDVKSRNTTGTILMKLTEKNEKLVYCAKRKYIEESSEASQEEN